MEYFEYDIEKSLFNKDKHGINFDEAKKLWEDDYRIEIKSSTKDEDRFIVIGKILDKYYTAAITYRNQRIRIISVRRSRKEEKEFYETKRQDFNFS